MDRLFLKLLALLGGAGVKRGQLIRHRDPLNPSWGGDKMPVDVALLNAVSIAYLFMRPDNRENGWAELPHQTDCRIDPWGCYLRARAQMKHFVWRSFSLHLGEETNTRGKEQVIAEKL